MAKQVKRKKTGNKKLNIFEADQLQFEQNQKELDKHHRAHCLTIAEKCLASGGDNSPNSIVNAAKKFYDFVENNQVKGDENATS